MADWLRVRHWRVRPAGWSAEPLRVVMVADVHAGWPQMPLARVDQVVDRKSVV